jgi:tetratricopeptide (TPR) repeat protein
VKKVVLLLFLLVWTVSVSVRADDASHPPPGDALSQGLWWLYQLQYEKAHQVFDAYTQDHPKDSAGYFYETATDWWQLAQDFDFKLPAIEKRLEEDYQKTVAVAEVQLKEATTDHDRGLACLYWGGAEGLKGRWLVAQRVWVKAYFLGKNGNALLHRALAYDPTLTDAYMGIGIYDYFTDTLKGVVGALSHLLIHGDRKRGLEELQRAIDQSQHARVESMIFLIEIYTSEENTPEKALPLTQQLHKEFPTSPAMHLAEIMAYYGMKSWPDVMVEGKKFLDLSQQQTPWYSKEGERPALYCMGVAELWGLHDQASALAHMNQILEGGIDSSRWVTFAYLRRGQIYDAQGQREKALADYKIVMDRPEFWGSHNEAAQYLDHPFK